MIEKLAKERFGGLQIEADAGNDAQKALKQMCKLMADVPPDVTKKNPSLQKISRIAGGGASYNAGKSEVKMNERPAQSPKADFPSAAGCLPEREEACKPANDSPADLFDFNMLHELAHSIDDSNHFMAARGAGSLRRLDRPWRQRRADRHRGRSQVRLRSQRRREEIRARPDPRQRAGRAAEACGRRRQVDRGRHQGQGLVDQAASEAIVIGTRIYHVAYPSRWVSYLASARKRGITGYRFRAPGEWFSELYAAYKLGKLKPEHPSVSWLKKLSI